MSKLNSTIVLINSLSKSEKKHISTCFASSDKSYFFIYSTIIKNPQIDKTELKKNYCLLFSKGSFDISVHYLYNKLLELLLELRKNKDPYYDLLQKISAARMLYERSMFGESLLLLSECSDEANKYKFYDLLIITQKLELEYLLYLNFPNISEQELFHKQHQQDDAIKNLRKIIDQSSLYGLLKHRIIYKGNIRTDDQKKMMSDLAVRELYLSASSDKDSFEISKNHQLFQANYLINEGSYSMALNSYKELNKLFEKNLPFLSNPPIYYMFVLEGTLANLRAIRQYDEIGYYLQKLKNLAKNTSSDFQLNVNCLIFQYELIPWLDKGDFNRSLAIFSESGTALFDKISLLNPIRKTELILYTSLVYIGYKRFKDARKIISHAILDNTTDYLPIIRTLRIVRLITYYELKDFDLIASESQSLRRGLTLKKERNYRLEHKMLWFLNKQNLPIQMSLREKMWQKLEPELELLHKDSFENQILVIFDFTAWMKSKILKKDLAEVLQEKYI